MITETRKQLLLDKFRNFLEQESSTVFSAGKQPDLHTLLSEMAGLKAEVQAESRHFKCIHDTLSSALAASQEDNKILSSQLASAAERLERQQQEIERAVFTDILEIYERLYYGLETLQNYRPSRALFRRSKKRDERFIKQLQEGQAMTVRRFEQLLQRYQVRAIDCVGKLFDPSLMRAVETGKNPKLVNGIVLEELRKGFLFKEQVLRPAEVKVNKISL